jgi:hypothetical protein
MFIQNLDSLIIDYLNGKSLAKIAKEEKINYNNLRDVFVERGIKIRSKYEALQKYVKYGECEICGKKFRMRERWDSSTSHHRKTCSPECESKLRSKAVKSAWTDEKKKHMSELFTGRDTSTWNIRKRESTVQWEGGKSPSVYRDIAFRELGLKQECVVCGSENALVHHKDKDRTNNNIDNLVVLCRPCHARLHNHQGDCGVNSANGYNNRKKNK